MDALALLCNLHGDGPVTLAALRDVGCEDLIGLEALGTSLLAELLGRDEAAASRFRREARVLRERIEGEVEESPAEESVESVDLGAAVIAPQPPPLSEPMATHEVSVESSALDATERPGHEAAGDEGPGPVVSAVLERWQQLDSGAPAPSASDVLRDVQLSGLKPADVLALERAGVRTLAELAEADLLRLASTAQLPYTHLAHLAFLARKARADAGAQPLAAPSRAQSEPLEAGQGPSDGGSAGPFA